ncbi:hypothetical protein ACQ4PT_044693 [Festuca glaucescens]
MDYILAFYVIQTVPCFVRRQFNDLVGNVMYLVLPDEVKYKFYIKKCDKKTKIYGDGYIKFIRDFEMNTGDSIVIDFAQAPELFNILPQCPDGIPKHRVQEEEAISVVHTNGLKLTVAQNARMDHLLAQRGIGMGAVFVHKITNTDTKDNRMRTPKAIVKTLQIPEEGCVLLTMDEYEINHQVAYYTSTDGRMEFVLG